MVQADGGDPGIVHHRPGQLDAFSSRPRVRRRMGESAPNLTSRNAKLVVVSAPASSLISACSTRLVDIQTPSAWTGGSPKRACDLSYQHHVQVISPSDGFRFRARSAGRQRQDRLRSAVVKLLTTVRATPEVGAD
jgi:hypothetical protein